MNILKFLLVFTLLAQLACKRMSEPEPIFVEPQPAEWQTYSSLNIDNFSCVKFFKTSQKLLMFGDNYLTELDTANRVIRQEKFSERPITGFGAKIHTNGVFFMHNSSTYFSSYFQKVTIRSVASPQIQLEIDITKIDTNYRYIGARDNSASGALTQDNRLFLPVVYTPKAYDFTNAELRFLVFKIQLVGNTIQAILEPKFIPIDVNITNVPKVYFLRTLDLLKPTDRYFYFSAWTTYRMDTQTGVYEQILDLRTPQMCYRNDTLWALGWGRQNEFSFSYLPPQQSNWINFSSNVEYQAADSYVLDKRFINVYNDRHLALFTPFWDNNKFEIRSLNDNNISYIRDMTLFNDRVYLATTQGLLFKPFKDFIVFPKEK